MGSRWRIRRFRTGPQSEPRGHFPPLSGSRRSAGVLPRRCGAERRIRARPSVNAPSGRGPRARERRLQARLAQQPTPTVPTLAACARRAFRGTRVVARRNALSTASTSTTPSGPARPFRLARVPRPGMTNTDVRRRTHPGDRTTQGPLYARSITSRTLSRTNPHAYTDADDNRAVGVATLAPRSLGRPLPPGVRYVTVQHGRVALTNAERQARYRERRKAGESRIRYRRPADRRSRPQQWNDAVQTLLELQEQVPGVAGRLAGSATAELLEQVCDLDLSVLEAVELPRGFGRDG